MAHQYANLAHMEANPTAHITAIQAATILDCSPLDVEDLVELGELGSFDRNGTLFVSRVSVESHARRAVTR